VRARIPLDIDLEDKLIYGLTPLRFGYVLVGGLGAMAVWAGGRPPVWPRLVVCLLLVCVGAAAGWVRRGGRHLDGWLGDIAVYLLRNYRIHVDLGKLQRRQRPGARISVTGAAPGVGATTITSLLARSPELDGIEVLEAASAANIEILVALPDTRLDRLRTVAARLRRSPRLLLVVNRAPAGRQWLELAAMVRADRVFEVLEASEVGTVTALPGLVELSRELAGRPP
jgi:hypothetical protein